MRDPAQSLPAKLLGWAILIYLVFPLGIIVAASFDPSEFFTFPPNEFSSYWYEFVLNDFGWQQAAWRSLLVGIVCALLTGFIGTLAGIAIGRSSKKWQRVLLAVAVAPQAIPGIVIAVSFYIFVLRLGISGTFFSLILANSVVTVSIVVLLVAAQAMGNDPQIELAARSCGAGPWRTLFTVSLPSVAPAALAGTALATVLTLDEVVISQFLVTGLDSTLPVKMYQEVAGGTPAVVNAVSSLLIAFGFAIALVRVASRMRSPGTSVATT